MPVGELFLMAIQLKSINAFFVIDENGKEIDVMDEKWDVTERPDYLELEKKINEVIPEPLWMRKMQEVSEKGLKFQRKE